MTDLRLAYFSLLCIALAEKRQYICGMGRNGNLRVECNPSAFKHGIDENDIRFAFAHRLFDHPVSGYEEKNLLIGLDRHLNPLEILYNEIDDDSVNVFHAMKCRKAWRNLAGLEDKVWQE